MAQAKRVADYSPAEVELYLHHWPQLEAAVQGGTGSAPGSSRGGRNGRETLVAIKADLERAADQLPLHWQQTARIFRLQGRFQVYLDRRAEARLPAGSDPGLSFPECCDRMARSLGWQPDTEERVA